MNTLPLFQRIDLLSAALGLIAALVWFVRADLVGACSLAAGTTVGVLNLAAIRTLVRGLLSGDREGQPKIVLLLGGKFAAMALVLFLLLSVVGLDAVAFAVGVSLVMLTLTVETFRAHLSARSADASQGNAG